MKYAIIGHQNPDVDSILSGVLLEKILNKVNDTKDYRFVIPDRNIEQITMQIVKNQGIQISKYQKRKVKEKDRMILVDHYSDKRFLNNEVIAIYDHHPTTSDYVFTKKPDSYYNKTSCSTTVVIAKKFEKILTKEDFILVLIGALVDTVSFHSNKTNQEEVKFLEKKCREFNINLNDYYDIGLCLNDLTNPDEDSFNGLKEYLIRGRIIHSSYVQIKDVEKNKDKITKMIERIRKYVKDNNLYAFIFLVHDMDYFKTTEYDIYHDHMDTHKWENYTSRGSSIIPEFDRSLMNKEIN